MEVFPVVFFEALLTVAKTVSDPVIDFFFFFFPGIWHIHYSRTMIRALFIYIFVFLFCWITNGCLVRIWSSFLFRLCVAFPNFKRFFLLLFFSHLARETFFYFVNKCIQDLLMNNNISNLI